MPKKFGHIKEQVCNLNNLYGYGYDKVKESKRFNARMYEFERNLDENMITILNELIYETYEFGPGEDRTIFDPKKRVITVQSIRDLVAQSTFHYVIEPLIESKMIDGSFACRKNKGLIKACDSVQKHINYGYKYFVHVDYKGCFDNMRHDIILYAWDRVFKDPFVHWFVDRQLKARGGDRGQVKGSVTSQDSCNLVLNLTDHFVTDECGFGAYARNMDDIVIGCRTHVEAYDLLDAIDDFSANRIFMPLSENKTFIERYDDRKGLEFCKRVIYSDRVEMAPRRLHQTIRKIRKFKRLGEYEKLENSKQSFLGEMKHLHWTPVCDDVMAEF